MAKYTDFITLHDVPETKKRARVLAGPFGNISKVLRLAISLGLDILEEQQNQKGKKGEK